MDIRNTNYSPANNASAQPTTDSAFTQGVSNQSYLVMSSTPIHITGKGIFHRDTQSGNHLYMDTHTLSSETEKLHQLTLFNQQLQITIGISSLKNAVIEILKFKEAAKTYTSKGDDKTCLQNLDNIIKECNQANKFQSISPQNYAFTPLLMVVPTREILHAQEVFEHAIKALEQCKVLLEGRTGHNFWEGISQNWTGWTGWMQQARMIKVHVNNLKSLLDVHDKTKFEQWYQPYFVELKNFADSMIFICDAFIKGSYPDSRGILDIYTNDTVINSESLSMLNIQPKPQKENTEVDLDQGTNKRPQSGFWSSLWGNNN